MPVEVKPRRSPPNPNHLHSASMAMWDVTISCRDGSRLRMSERRDHAPFIGGTFETADAGQIIKARIDTCREEKPIGGSHSFPSHSERNIKSAKVIPCRFPAPWTVEDHNNVGRNAE